MDKSVYSPFTLSKIVPIQIKRNKGLEKKILFSMVCFYQTFYFNIGTVQIWCLICENLSLTFNLFKYCLPHTVDNC